jgi:hypothetical protein
MTSLPGRSSRGPSGNRLAAAARRLLGLAAAVLLAATAAGAETTVPLDLQVDLMQRVVRFEHGFAARAGSQVNLAVVVRSGDANSEKTGAALAKALARVTEMAGKPVVLSTVTYSKAAALKQAAEAKPFHLLYLAPGFEGEMAAIAAAFDGLPVITLSTDGDQVDAGAVMGFELVSAKPRIALNLGQAKRQGLDFSSDLFRLVRVVK